MTHHRTALVIVGMHRSGTSAITRVLNFLGASLPEHIVPAGLGNEAGHWEPQPAPRLNDRILAAAGAPVNGLCGPPMSWFRSDEARAFLDKMKALIVEEYGASSFFVFKDPRTSLLLPLWYQAFDELEITVKAVVAFRHPIEVAQSLAKRQTHVFPHQTWPLDRGGLLWLRYNLGAESHTRQRTRSFCDYSDLMSDWRITVRRLGDELGIPWPRSLAEAEAEIDGFLSASLRHYKQAGEFADLGKPWVTWIAPVYASLRAACSGQHIDNIMLDAVARSFDAACDGLKHYINVMEERIEELANSSAMAPHPTEDATARSVRRA